ncbi:hypothetical protein [Priestia megaterium]|uniref:hypothetical protein n=1 Tax=Priestia megaterium TaxID=1404 RepID=UPI00064C5B05|nr:hypothetical protein [Priestia megaterium]KLV28948.1 hypothetical protein ABW04_26985 [Priestia megaterium]MCE4092555.1 hypothetical protein [Priestia megaterium]
MKSIIKFYCNNYNCREYEVEKLMKPNVLLEFSYCKSCGGDGKFKINHGDKNFESPKETTEYLNGAKTEYLLLKRLNEAKACTEEDIIKLENLEKVLSDATCLCCNQLLLKQ